MFNSFLGNSARESVNRSIPTFDYFADVNDSNIDANTNSHANNPPSGLCSLNPTNSFQENLSHTRNYGILIDERQTHNDPSTFPNSNYNPGNRTNELDESDEVIMAVIFYKDRLGIAVLETGTATIYVAEVQENAKTFHSLEAAKFQFKPDLIITTSKSSEDLISVAKTGFYGAETIPVTIQKSTDFGFETSQHKLSQIEIATIPKNIKLSEKESYLSSLISFEDVVMIQALGGLLSYLHRHRLIRDLEDHTSPLSFSCLKYFALNDILIIDQVTYKALQIFSQDRHPSIHNIGKSKEGLSLFSILDNTKSTAGRRLLRSWFLRPTLNLTVISERHDCIAWLLVNPEITNELGKCIKNIKEIQPIAPRLMTSKTSLNDWTNLRLTCLYCYRICEVVRTLDCREVIGIFRAISDCQQCEEHLLCCFDKISSVIDFEQLKHANGQFTVKSGIDEQLDQLRSVYDSLTDFLTEVGIQECERYPSIVRMSVVYFFQMGYLLCIPKETPDSLAEEINGLDFRFATNDAAYYKSPQTKLLDEDLGDIVGSIIDIQNRIKRELESCIRDSIGPIIKVADVCAELDCLMSLAIAANDRRYSRPRVVEDNVMCISKGRHPLQELVTDTFVPNDTDLQIMRTGSVALITGPNSSGKSVYIKQVAVITFMAHIGSFVPCDVAIIGLTDRIFSRISSLETVALAQSTFVIDVSQIAYAIRHSTVRSLIVVDEFGKGTEELDGIALLGACIKSLLDREDQCPKLLVSTHFHDLIEIDELIKGHPNLAEYTMDVYIKEPQHEPSDTLNTTGNVGIDGTERNGTISFLYKLTPGHCSISFAIFCAAKAGIPISITSRAAEICEAITRNEPITRLDVHDGHLTDAYYDNLANLFLSFNCDSDDVSIFVNQVNSLTLESRRKFLLSQRHRHKESASTSTKNE